MTTAMAIGAPYKNDLCIRQCPLVEDNTTTNNNNNKNDSHHYSCTLYNPDEKDKLYKTQDLGVEFGKSVCKAIYGSWLLMKDPLNKLYIVNIFTNERINLNPVELLWKDYEFNTTSRQKKMIYGGRMKSVRSPVFWIDEKTKDYVVIWGFGMCCVVYSKTKDTSWNKIPKTSFCFNIVYRDHKLYFLNFHDEFKIFDFSGEVPQQTFEWMVYVDKWNWHLRHPPDNSWHSNVTTLVVTLTGKVLKVERMWVVTSRTWSLRVFEVYSSDLQKNKQRQIHSLGDESILLDQGITVLANDTDGFVRSTIYFSDPLFYVRNHMFTFNLETQKTEPLHTFDISSFQFSSAQWFVPSSFTLT
ncbi:PREDICTED: putative F-box protein At4g22170 [Camelina sativa]|uniref:F-box protein At4g22170 n=1 Tax=Camelina sativa TaxID=90675 RepID=A0ABM0URW3_CAMSA|nr:PREDICTED: putative F-box protein At4g22170 [Camelina sativa]